jgi:hypothetical protein
MHRHRVLVSDEKAGVWSVMVFGYRKARPAPDEVMDFDRVGRTEGGTTYLSFDNTMLTEVIHYHIGFAPFAVLDDGFAMMQDGSGEYRQCIVFVSRRDGRWPHEEADRISASLGIMEDEYPLVKPSVREVRDRVAVHRTVIGAAKV